MQELFGRTLSQGLQAFMPLAVFFGYALATHRSDLTKAAYWAMAAAALLTVPAGYLFQHTSHQAGSEALLATAAVAITAAFGRAIRSDRWSARLQPSVAAVALTLLLVRQTMEIEVVFEAALI